MSSQGRFIERFVIRIFLIFIWRDVDDFGSWEDPWANTSQQRQPEPAEEFELHEDHELLNVAHNRENDRDIKYEDGNTIGACSLLGSGLMFTFGRKTGCEKKLASALGNNISKHSVAFVDGLCRYSKFLEYGQL